MIICMSNTIPGDGFRNAVLLLAGISLASCTVPGEAQTAQSAEPPTAQTAAVQPTGAPALPVPDDAAIADRSQVISMEDMAAKFPSKGKGPGCFITFAYRGYAPETLIWDGEPCSALTAQFGDQTFLKAHGNWDRLDPSQQADVAKAPEGEVFYVEGQFTASIYPIGLNRLTYEVAVSD